MTRSAAERLIVALDVDNARTARSIVDGLAGQVGAFKVGLQLFVSAGPEFVRELCDAGHRIFLDLKFHDIPNTVAMASVEAARLGVWMFNVHASGGREMMVRTVSEVGEFCDRESLTRPIMLAVTVLTSSAADDLAEIGIEASAESQVGRLARLAAASGMDGVVASAREAAAVRRLAGADLTIVTPGIRPLFATNGDQKRVTTPSAAVAAGSDLLVVGRPILEAEDMSAAVLQICKEIETVL